MPDESFDLVHARYVLIHNADAENVLATMLRALKPGGLLVLEEPDFSAAAALVGPPHWRQAFENVKRAIDAVFSGRGMTYAFGRTLPGLLQQTKASLSRVEYDCVVNRGGSGLAEMMRRSTLALEDKYVGTGYATPEDIAGYAGFASSHDCWGIYYATVRALARKMAG